MNKRRLIALRTRKAQQAQGADPQGLAYRQARGRKPCAFSPRGLDTPAGKRGVVVGGRGGHQCASRQIMSQPIKSPRVAGGWRWG